MIKVNEYLAGASHEFLRDIVDHGIHNLVNDFNSEDYDFEAIAEQLKIKAEEILIQHHMNYKIKFRTPTATYRATLTAPDLRSAMLLLPADIVQIVVVQTPEVKSC